MISTLTPGRAAGTRKKPVDGHLLVIYHPCNTGKEVIQKYMSSNHSEVAAA